MLFWIVFYVWAEILLQIYDQQILKYSILCQNISKKYIHGRSLTRVFQHFSNKAKQTKQIYFHFRNLDIIISKKSEQNEALTALPCLVRTGLRRPCLLAVFDCLNLLLVWSNFGFGQNSLEFWIWGTEIPLKPQTLFG